MQNNHQELKGIIILVAEDNEMNQQVVKEILECSGAVAAMVQHGKETTGMNDFLAKPVDPDLLVNTILKWLIPIKQATEINSE